MLPINSDTKVGRFWDYPIEKINDDTLEQIKMIVSFKQKVCKKKKIEHWTDKEYKEFCSVINSFPIVRFQLIISVANAIIELPQLEYYRELLNLLNKGILEPNPNDKTVPYMLANAIVQIQSKILSISRLPITEAEKEISENLNDEIIKYEQILIQMENPDSDYNQTLKEVFRNWVSNNFSNSLLKNTILEQESMILKNKHNELKKHLKKLYYNKEKEKTIQADSHIADTVKNKIMQKRPPVSNYCNKNKEHNI